MKFINSRKVAFGSLGLVVSLFGVSVEGAIAQQEQSLQNLPDGNYIYEEVTSPTSLKLEKFLFRKVGVFVAGYRSRTDWGYCFKGQLQDLSLINVTMADPKFGRGVSGFDFKQEEPVDLRNYQQVNLNKRFSNSTKLTENLQQCLNLFPLPSSPKISKSIPPLPASSKPVKQANSGDGYPTDAEIQRLSQEFEQTLIPEMQRSRQFGLGKRDAALERFTQEWAKSDRSASFFLGRWASRGVDDMYIYPSSNQGKVCIIWTMPARSSDRRDRVDALFSLGVISNRQLKANNMFFDRRKTVILRSGNYLATTSNRDNVPQVSAYSAFSYPLSTIESLPLAGTVGNRKVVQQFYDAGCTASLPLVNNSIPSVPSSTTPVKPTDAIARYPTNDDFEKVDRTLYRNLETQKDLSRKS